MIAAESPESPLPSPAKPRFQLLSRAFDIWGIVCLTSVKILAPAVAFLFAVIIVTNLVGQTDTTRIAVAAVAVFATLAGVSFSYARCLADGDFRDRIVFAGERFLHAVIFGVVGTVLQYVYVYAMRETWIKDHEALKNILAITLGSITGVLFFQAVGVAHTGIRVLNYSLFSRYTRYKDWDKLL